MKALFLQPYCRVDEVILSHGFGCLRGPQHVAASLLTRVDICLLTFHGEFTFLSVALHCIITASSEECFFLVFTAVVPTSSCQDDNDESSYLKPETTQSNSGLRDASKSKSEDLDALAMFVEFVLRDAEAYDQGVETETTRTRYALRACGLGDSRSHSRA